MTYSLITHKKKQAGFSLSPLMLPFYALDHNDLMTSATTTVLCRGRYYEYTSCLLDGKHHHTLSLSESVVKIYIYVCKNFCYQTHGF